eukprot:3999390-Pleurochrysis_carterae.AAC.1
MAAMHKLSSSARQLRRSRGRAAAIISWATSAVDVHGDRRLTSLIFHDCRLLCHAYLIGSISCCVHTLGRHLPRSPSRGSRGWLRRGARLA